MIQLTKRKKEDDKGNFSAGGGSSRDCLCLNVGIKSVRLIILWYGIPSQLQTQVEHYINDQQTNYSVMSLSSYHVIRLKKIHLRMQFIIYDGMAIVRSVASQKTWGGLWRWPLECFTPNRVHNPLKMHILFNNYIDNQTFSVKQTKRVGRKRLGKRVGKRLHIGNDSQEMPQGGDYKDFLKSNLKKADLIRQFDKLVQREMPHFHVDYPLVVTLEKEARELTGVQN